MGKKQGTEEISRNEPLVGRENMIVFEERQYGGIYLLPDMC